MRPARPVTALLLSLLLPSTFSAPTVTAAAADTASQAAVSAPFLPTPQMWVYDDGVQMLGRWVWSWQLLRWELSDTVASVIHVSPNGSDTATGQQGDPLASIQAAVDKAQPGDAVFLSPGEYHGPVQTVRDGTAEKPIRVIGPGWAFLEESARQATLYGKDRIVKVDHDNIVFEGFTIDGQEKLTKAGVVFPTTTDEVRRFKEAEQSSIVDGRGVYVGSAEDSSDVSGGLIRNMRIEKIGGECVRMRNKAHNNTVRDSVITHCGLYAKPTKKGKTNGEGGYVGTSLVSVDQPMSANDTSNNNTFTDNLIRTFGSECFNVKENAYRNRFSRNICEGNLDDAQAVGSAVEIRGPENEVTDNLILNTAGALVKIQADSDAYSTSGNVVTGNTMEQNTADPALRLKSSSGQKICDNTVLTPMGSSAAALTAPCS